MALRSMRARCYSRNNNRFYRYGARGIAVCKEWRIDKDAFVAWSYANGFAPHLTIDRIDNDGDYEPTNCQWVNRHVQAHNKVNNVLSMARADEIRTLYASGDYPMRQLAALYNTCSSTVHGIIHRKKWIE